MKKLNQIALVLAAMLLSCNSLAYTGTSQPNGDQARESVSDKLTGRMEANLNHNTVAIYNTNIAGFDSTPQSDDLAGRTSALKTRVDSTETRLKNLQNRLHQIGGIIN